GETSGNSESHLLSTGQDQTPICRLPLFTSATVWVETGNETRKLENVIRSDGHCRTELLGSYPRGSREEDQSSVVRDVAEANALLPPRREEAFCPNPLCRLSAHWRSIRRPHRGSHRQSWPRR